MRHFRSVTVGAMLLLFGASACADLDVTNPNDPDAARALATAGDIESLIAGSFNNWFIGTTEYSGAGMFLSNASFQHTAPWANGGMEQYGRIPRIAIINDVADVYYGQFTYAWGRYYRALAAIADGLKAFQDDPALASELGADRVARATAYARFVQGLAHANLALLYDQAVILDENTVRTDEAGQSVSVPPSPYTEVMDTALKFFDMTIDLADGATWGDIPAQWMSVDVSAADLVRIAHSMKARYRAEVARTPAERAAVDWAAVIADVDAGITQSWQLNESGTLGFRNWALHYSARPGWDQTPYFIIGMADQSGNYQTWLNTPVSDRKAIIGDTDILIITPDERFPQGNTVAEQEADNDQDFVIPTKDEWGHSIAGVWARPDRGTWRWSYYWYAGAFAYTSGDDWYWNQIDINEMNLLKAEGLYRQGDLTGAATIVNLTREAAGLNATDANGTNTSCVPRLPDETCGDLWEMLKWEKRLEVHFEGLQDAPWYFDSRGWGDLYKGTYLQFPMPCREIQLLQLDEDCASYGGYVNAGVEGMFSAPLSTYAYPYEN